MSINLCWRVVWAYQDASGRMLPQYEMSGDFIALALAQVPGGDGTMRPDMTDVKSRIAANYVTPPGASIVIRLISSSQVPVVFS